MKLSELKKMVDMSMENPNNHDCEVTIEVSGEKTFPSTPSVKVEFVGRGFDWDSWQFMIKPSEKLYKKK